MLLLSHIGWYIDSQYPKLCDNSEQYIGAITQVLTIGSKYQFTVDVYSKDGTNLAKQAKIYNLANDDLLSDTMVLAFNTSTSVPIYRRCNSPKNNGYFLHRQSEELKHGHSITFLVISILITLISLGHILVALYSDYKYYPRQGGIVPPSTSVSDNGGDLGKNNQQKREITQGDNTEMSNISSTESV